LLLFKAGNAYKPTACVHNDKHIEEKQVITTLEMPIANTIIAIPTNNTVQPKYS
jgi:hypothetical protein